MPPMLPQAASNARWRWALRFVSYADPLGQPVRLGAQLVDSGPNGVRVREPLRIERRVFGPLARHRRIVEDRRHRALRLAGATFDALVWIDVEDPIDCLVADVDTGYGADVDATLVL